LPERIHDVVIAGAGPAGARMARDLALLGFDVVVLEEHSGIGTPCHCSGLVTPRTLELADVGDDVIVNTIRGAVIHVPGCEPVVIGGDRVHALVIDRTEFDRRVVGQAKEAGATIVPLSRLEHFAIAGSPGQLLMDGCVEVDVRREGVATKVRTRLLVGADGALSRVATQLRGHRPRGVVSGLGASADYDRNPREDHVEVFLDPSSAPGWFGWTIPLGHGIARLGTGSANGVKPKESFERLRRGFPDSFGAARVHAHSGGTIALWEPTPMIADRVMLVGDAARQVKPTSGGGIHAALQAAGVAAAVAGDALNRGDASKRSLRTYPHLWNRGAGKEMRRQHDMRRTFQRLTTRDLQTLVPILRDHRMRSTVDAVGDIDFPSRMVGRVARERPQLLLKLLPWPRFPLAWVDSL
jgi:digeranylgeranylglycerophospholipid reductase